MAGVYIHGMEMPRNCRECSLSGDWYCNALPHIPAWHKEYVEALTAKTKMSRCPLIEVPQHGRLIDADAVREEIDRLRPGRMYEDAWALTVMDNAPTIITADEEDTNANL